jgi:hypothetical protein
MRSDDNREAVARSEALHARIAASEEPYFKRAVHRWKSAPRTLTDYDIWLIRRRDSHDGHRAEAARRRGTYDEPDVEKIAGDAARRERVTARLKPAGILWRNEFIRSLNDHAIDLVMSRSLEVVCSGVGGRACASQDNRSITVPPVTDESSYAVFLHEFGHVASPEGDSRQFRHQVTEDSLIAIGGEVGAWRDAVTRAKWWTPVMQARLAKSLGSYSSSSFADAEQRRDCDTLIAWAETKMRSHPQAERIAASNPYIEAATKHMTSTDRATFLQHLQRVDELI